MSNLNTETITIPMSSDVITTIDSADSDLAQFHWGVKKTSDGMVYVKREITIIPQIKGKQKRKRKELVLHRMILERVIGRKLQQGEKCDHVNGNTLDNRRGNLRLATHAQNSQNVGLSQVNTSGHKGVYFYKRYNNWRADIRANGKRYFLGYFDTAELAALAYRRAAEGLHGEFARLE